MRRLAAATGGVAGRLGVPPTAAATTPGALTRMPRSPSTVRRPGGSATACVRGVVLRDSAEYTSVVAPPTSTTSSVPAVRVGGQQLDAGQHRVRGGGRAPATANRGPRDSLLPPITWRRNTSRIAARAGPGSSTPMRGQHVARRDDRTPAPAAGRGGVARVGVAGEHHRHRQPGRGEPGRVVQQHLPVAAVGAADQQHHIRAGGAQCGTSGGVEPAGRHVHDLAPADSADPVPGLGGDQPLVADDGQPQAAAGRRAGQHLAPAVAGRPSRRRPRPAPPGGVVRAGRRRAPHRPPTPATPFVHVEPTSRQEAIVNSTVAFGSAPAAESPPLLRMPSSECRRP